MRPQRGQMPQVTAPDRLDAAIDLVAARIVEVKGHEELAARIAAALPGRSSSFGWWLPQFAAIAAFAIAAVLWTARDTATPSLLPSTDVVAMMAVPDSVAAAAPGTASRIASRTKPLEPLGLLEQAEPLDGDFGRSLAPIAAIDALTVSELGAPELPAASPLVLPPIAITDLPLTAESFSPR